MRSFGVEKSSNNAAIVIDPVGQSNAGPSRRSDQTELTSVIKKTMRACSIMVRADELPAIVNTVEDSASPFWKVNRGEHATCVDKTMSPRAVGKISDDLVSIVNSICDRAFCAEGIINRLEFTIEECKAMNAGVVHKRSYYILCVVNSVGKRGICAGHINRAFYAAAVLETMCGPRAVVGKPNDLPLIVESKCERAKLTAGKGRIDSDKRTLGS